MDITMLLKRLKKVMIHSGVSHIVLFKYEELPAFCIICEIIEHTEKFYPKCFDGIALKELKADP